MVKAKRRKLMAEINVVPYIDVMLVLLVIFMVAAPFIMQGIKVDLPDATSTSLDLKQDELTLVVTIKADQSYHMNLGKVEEPVSLPLIASRTTKIIDANPNIKVLVEGDQNLPYGVIVNLMSILQQAGAKHVGLVTEPLDQ